MTKIYACLIGNWVCLNDDPDCVISDERQSPYFWWEDGAPIYSPNLKTEEHTFYQLDYVNLHYKGKDYRINPIFIQIVNE